MKRETEERLLETAERLFGIHGLDGVSLRQIGVEAGSLNTVAVRYHFGGKTQLLEAIVHRRIPSQEARRALLLSEASLAGTLDDPKVLLGIILRPMADERDCHGGHSYAAFMLSLRRSASPWYPTRTMSTDSPVMVEVLNRLQSTMPQLPKSLFLSRVWHASTLYLSALVDRDQRVGAGLPTLLPDDEFLVEILDMAAAALLAPLSPAVARAVAKIKVSATAPSKT
jgi:AcrR family transcriptional regulator